MSFKVGDNIVYAGSGVCQIDAIKDISFFKEKHLNLKNSCCTIRLLVTNSRKEGMPCAF